MNVGRAKSRGNASRTPGSSTRSATSPDKNDRQALSAPGTSRGNTQTTALTPGHAPSSIRPPSSLRFEMRVADSSGMQESTTPAPPSTGRAPTSAFVSPRNVYTPSTRPRRPSQGGSKQAPAATPHKKAADKVKELRRRALLSTPGRARRQSGRLERNDPMDNLRRLARSLKPKSQPIPSSSSPAETSDAALPVLPRKHDDDDDDDDDLMLQEPRSRLSLNSDSDEEYGDPTKRRELQEAVERTRVLEEYDLTTHSVELPRRVAPELPNDARLGRRSSMFDGIEDPESDISRDVGMGFRLDSSPQRRVPFADDSDFRIEVPEEMPVDAEETTFAIGEALYDEAGRPSDFQLPLMEDDISILEAAAEDAAGMDDDDVVDDDDGPGGFEEAVVGSADEGASDSEVDADPLPTLANNANAGHHTPARVQKRGRGGKRHALAMPDKHVKKIAGRFMKRNGGNIRFSRETLDRLGVMTDWFFERLSNSLEAYANHAGRKTLRESDMHLVMKRQRLINSKATPFFLANKHLDASLQRLIRDPPLLHPEKGGRQPQGLGRNDRRITPFNLDGEESILE